MIEWKGNAYLCDVDLALRLIGGKWKGHLLWYLTKRTHRYSELQKLIPTVSKKVLTEQLRQMEDDGLIVRTVFAEVPPRVEYSLTKLGESLEPVLQVLKEWSTDMRKN